MHWQVKPNEYRKLAIVSNEVFTEKILLTIWNLDAMYMMQMKVP